MQKCILTQKDRKNACFLNQIPHKIWG